MASAPVPTPAPPVTQNNAEVLSVEKDTARQALAKKTVAQTIWAGDTGGFKPGGNNPANLRQPPTGFAR